MKVLIADDEGTSRILLEDALQEWGYETCTAANGTQALAIMMREDAPAIAILDWMMPGADGPDICRKLRESARAQYMYLILLTSKSEKKDVILGMDSGADAFLTKPVALEELRSRLAAGKRILEHQTRFDLLKRKSDLVPPGLIASDIHVDAGAVERFVSAAEDLNRDLFLTRAPRCVFGSRAVPVLGKILLLNKIGEGGMGSVYRGFNPRLQTEVAVKVLATDEFQDRSDAAARFYREAQIASVVKSDHLVSVIDVDQAHGLIYLIMELVDGKTATDCVNNYIRAGQAGMPEHFALDVCIGAIKGLAAAHNDGIIHRDVKPDNFLVPYNDARTGLDYGATKLADLGIARRETHKSGLTPPHAMLGTSGFSAPEQIADARKASKAADIFSFGATMYVLLCGREPFSGNSKFEVFNATINKPYKPIESWGVRISATSAAILAACLAKKPEERYPSATTLLEDLIYCRRLLQTRNPKSEATSVSLPPAIEQLFSDTPPTPASK